MMVGCADYHGVEGVRLVEQVAIVTIELGRFEVLLGALDAAIPIEHRSFAVGLFVRIAQGDHTLLGHPAVMSAASSADSDHGDAQGFLRLGGADVGMGDQGAGSGQGGLEERAAIQGARLFHGRAFHRVWTDCEAPLWRKRPREARETIAGGAVLS